MGMATRGTLPQRILPVPIFRTVGHFCMLGLLAQKIAERGVGRVADEKVDRWLRVLWDLEREDSH
jgi:hypothetical protein